MKIAYTDGACSNNQSDINTGGWSWAIFDGESVVKEKCDGAYNTTNNIMEATAIQSILMECHEDLSIHTDSELCINWITGVYKIKVKNERDKIRAAILHDIINKISERNKNGIKTEFVKVKGHSNNAKNNYVDKKAVEMTKNFKRI